MADEIAIILDNAGNNVYAQAAREYITSPIVVNMMRVMLFSEAQINNVIKIRNNKSFGSQSNRDISLLNFISAMDKTNLIIDVPLNPEIVIDGQTYFQVDIDANKEIDLLFYFDQTEIGDLLRYKDYYSRQKLKK